MTPLANEKSSKLTPGLTTVNFVFAVVKLPSSFYPQMVMMTRFCAIINHFCVMFDLVWGFKLHASLKGICN